MVLQTSDASVSVKLSKSSRARVKFPRFPLPETLKKDWTRLQLKEFVEETPENSPEKAVYIIGKQAFPYVDLGPGAKVKRRGSGNLTRRARDLSIDGDPGCPRIALINQM